MKYIPYSHQLVDDDDIQKVVDVLKSDWITQGSKIGEFEEALCQYTGAQYAVAVSNGTAGLHLACVASGIQPSDEVITSPISFLASANCVVYCGGRPVFADIEKGTANIDPKAIKKRITKKTKAVIPIHFAGRPCEIEEIYAIAQGQDLTVIEDACHALGAKYRAKNQWFKVGSCRHSDMTVFSFHPVKSITTGEGGAVLTNRKDLYEKLLVLRTHGIVNSDDQMKLKEQSVDTRNVSLSGKDSHSMAPWYYEMQTLGYNYRITDIQCSLGLSQLKKLDQFIAQRGAIAERYNEAFSESPYLMTPHVGRDRQSAWHLYVLALKLDKINQTRREIFEKLRSLDIGVHVHYIPIHLQPYYREKFGYKNGDFPIAEAYYDASITVPLFPSMTGEDCERVIKGILTVVV